MEDDFFARTDYDRVIFVQSAAEVVLGEIVSVAAVLEAAGKRQGFPDAVGLHDEKDHDVNEADPAPVQLQELVDRMAVEGLHNNPAAIYSSSSLEGVRTE